MTRTNTSLSKKALALALSAAVASSFSFPAMALAAEAEGSSTAATTEAATQLPFEVAVDGAKVEASAISYADAAYRYDVYISATESQTIMVPAYTVTLPRNTKSVALSFSKECLVYNYKLNSGAAPDWIGPWYNDSTKGKLEYSVETDANGDYIADAIQVQNPYNADYSGGELLYAVLFDVELGPQAGESVTVDLGGGSSASLKVTAAAEGGKAGAVVLNSLSSSAASVSIPSCVTIGSSSYAVTSVAAGAFKGKTALRSVSVPASVTSIGASAFRGCSKLSSLSIGKKVASIGVNVISGCPKLKTVTVKSAKLTKKGVRSLVKGTAVTTLKCTGLSKAVKAKYATWAKIYNKKVTVK